MKTCDRCTALTLDGTRCKRNTCTTGPTCYQHTQGLRVKPSHVAGKGLFATRNFQPNTLIAPYVGEKLKRKTFNRQHRDPQYAIGVGNWVIDARRSNSGVARYINDCRETRYPCNASFDKAGRSRVLVHARRRIRTGSEIFAPYGSGYWRGRG